MAGDAYSAFGLVIGPVSIHARAWRATIQARPRRAPSRFNSRPRMAGDRTTTTRAGHTRSFNSRPRMAGDSRATRRPPSPPRFNSRPRMAGDHKLLQACADTGKFQFTPAHGGRQLELGIGDLYSAVSIHARAWRATVLSDPYSTLVQFQFTPAHGGRHSRVARRSDLNVSIHARAWRATRGPSASARATPVSIHARAWRAT